MTRQTGFRSDARANKMRVLDAARAVFVEKGLTAEMKEISDRAGVGMGTIYRNFPTKHDLIYELLGESIELMRQRVEAAEREADPVLGLHTALVGLYKALDEYGWLIDAVIGGQVLPDQRLRKELNPDDPKNQGLERMIRRAIDRGVVRQNLNIQVAVATLSGTLGQWSHRTTANRLTADEMAHEVLSIFLHGVAESGPDVDLTTGPILPPDPCLSSRSTP